MKNYIIPEDELFRLIETCHNENNCIQGDIDCKCQQALKSVEEIKNSRLKEIKPLEELFNRN